jgi:hypothetical protein
MDENRPSSFKIAMNSGILLGLALIVFSLITYLLDLARESPLQYLSFVIILVLVFIFVKQWRDKYNDGFITFGGAYSHGLLVIFLASLITAVYTFIFFGYIAPGEIAKIIEEAEQSILKSQPDISDSDLEMALSITEMFTKPWLMAVMAILINILAGLIIAIIPAAILKKEQTEF